jgi:hypothetical protein
VWLTSWVVLLQEMTRKQVSKKNKRKKKMQDMKPTSDLLLLGSVAADLLCALMDCSRVSLPLRLALVRKGRVLDYIEAATFSTDQAAKWMRFLEAAIAPKPCEDTSSADSLLLPAAADLCVQVRAVRLCRNPLACDSYTDCCGGYICD